jgi:hypothetical protein
MWLFSILILANTINQTKWLTSSNPVIRHPWHPNNMSTQSQNWTLQPCSEGMVNKLCSRWRKTRRRLLEDYSNKSDTEWTDESGKMPRAICRRLADCCSVAPFGSKDVTSTLVPLRDGTYYYYSLWSCSIPSPSSSHLDLLHGYYYYDYYYSYSK